jgi:hypothetical protein
MIAIQMSCIDDAPEHQVVPWDPKTEMNGGAAAGRHLA